METNRSTLAVVALGLAVALGACDSVSTINPPVVGFAVGDSASCYHDWTEFFLKEAPDALLPQSNGRLSGPGTTQDVPMYHDCQRFEKSETQYGAFFAIFATQRVVNLPTLTEQNAVPVVQIVAWDNYLPLNIEVGFNCVYMYMSGGSRVARIVRSGSTEGNCLTIRQVDAALLAEPLLEVNVSPTAGLTLTDADIPPVARWDRDTTNGQYYFGVKCHNAWCEVGDQGFVSSLSPLEVLNATPGAAPPLPPGLQRRYAVKGWHDQQYLSVMSGGTVIPSKIKGTVIPDAGLATAGEATFINWVPVVRVLLDTTRQGNNPYRDKLNLGHTPPGQFNLVELCRGTSTNCLGMPNPPTCNSQRYQTEASMSGITPQNWYAKITRVDGVVAFRCVMARATPTSNSSFVPRTARWHFIDVDDFIWQWCPSGCCEEWSEG